LESQSFLPARRQSRAEDKTVLPASRQ
jgi:hypothetical protein